MDLMRLYVGSHYGQEHGTAAPLNLTELTINIYLHRIVGEPNFIVSTPYRVLKHRAGLLEMALNHLLREIRFTETIETVCLEALISIGLVKIAIAETTQLELNGYLHDDGQPYCDAVSLDDWVHDVQAKRWDQSHYFGNAYEIPYELAMDSGLFGPKKDKISPPSEGVQDEDRDTTLAHGGSGIRERDTFLPTIRLWDIWLPHENRVLTLQQTSEKSEEFSGTVLREIDWTGPENGPYRHLSFNTVPNNIMPLPPISLCKDMAELANELFKKIGRQAYRQKTILGVRKGGDTDGERILEAEDGQAIALDDPKNAQEYTFGGVNRESMAFLIWMRDLFSYMQGNLETMGGLGVQADTLGQEQMLSVNSNVRISTMRKKLERFVEDCGRDLAYHLWYSPTLRIPLVKKTPVEGVEVQTEWRPPKDNEGDFLDYNIQIEPFSMNRKSPEERLVLLDRFVKDTLIPLLPLAQQQGILIDIERLTKLYSKYSRVPELEDILVFTNPKEPETLPVEPSGKPAETTRRYIRENRPGATRQGHDQVLMSELLAGNSQPSEKQALFRPVG